MVKYLDDFIIVFKKNKAMKELIKKDIDILFSEIQTKNNFNVINQIWEMLSYAKGEGCFDKQYYQYCFIKTLAFSMEEGLFIVCVKKITQEICEFKENDLGKKISEIVDFYLALNNLEKSIILINYAIQGGAVFERAWLKNTIEFLSIDNPEVLILKNIENEKNYINKQLRNKD